MIVILMGVSGTGKTTVGALLAKAIGCSFCDADQLHEAINIDKMARGEPLSDGDRWPWLGRVRARMVNALSRGESLVVACSALRQTYRRLLVSDDSAIRFVYLRGTTELISQRLRSREGHFMKEGMLESQLAALEEPAPNEAFVVDIAAQPAEIVRLICDWL